VLELLGRVDEAVASYEKALRTPGEAVEGLEAQLERARAMLASPPWGRDLVQAGACVRQGRYTKARALYEKGLAAAESAGAPADAKARPLLLNAYYNLACCLSLASAGRAGPREEAKPVEAGESRALKKRAVEALRKARDLGLPIANAAADSDLEPLKGDPEFEALLREGKK
jgi:tetratricopeptide (TPR) repeat protein